MNRPHSREKRIIDKKVEVTKRPIGASNNTQTKANTLFDIFRKIVKKWEEKIVYLKLY